MSHTVTTKAVEIRNVECLNQAIVDLSLVNLGHGRHALFGNNEAAGIGVRLPGWKYPVVIDPEKGEAKYDNYGGGWGKQIELDKLYQHYLMRQAEYDATINGYTFEHAETLENGDVKVRMTEMASV